MHRDEFRARWAGRREWRDRVADTDEPLGGDDQPSASSSSKPHDAAEELYTAINDLVEHAVEFAIAPLASMFRSGPPPPRGRSSEPPPPAGAQAPHEHDHGRGGRWRDSRWRQAGEHDDRA